VFKAPGPLSGSADPYGAESAINRKDFGLSFNMVLDGKLVVSEEVKIMIEGELVEQETAGVSG
jgi:hypothetical protein